jgi:hypothetical protein
MNLIAALLTTMVISISQFDYNANAQDGHHSHPSMGHEMQHGFIISDDETFFSHLVATGHHSHQLTLSGKLSIKDLREKTFYDEHKKKNKPYKSYFLFQAQKLDLPATTHGQILRGHIIESPVGDYTPNNVIVKNAEIIIDRVYINIPNPFFTEP